MALTRPEIYLKTKLIRPQARGERVLRQRLVQQLAGVFFTPLTLVCAPAGYGKTTLLVDWAQASPALVAWLSLSEDENAPDAFLNYLILAIQQIDPELGKSAQVVLDFPGEMLLENGLRLLINDLAGLKSPAALVLDDYHWITDSAVHEMVNFLVEQLPPVFHLVIASRTEPAIAMARFRGRSAVMELRAADLCFRPEEITVFFRQVMNLALSEQRISQIEQETEGWAAGLQLAALSLRNGEDAFTPSAFLSGQHYIFDYLAEEVLHRLPLATQRFLMRTAILDRVTGPLAEVLVEPFDPHHTGAACLDALEHANLFIQALDGEHRWYRYHALFADFLRDRLLQTEPESLPLLHERAARWLAEQGSFEEACKHALAGKNQDLLVWLIETYAQTLERQGELTILSRWISLLPDAVVRGRPRISLTRAWISAAQLDIQTASTYLDCAEARLDTAEDGVLQAGEQDLRGEILSARAFIAAVNDKPDEVQWYSEEILQIVPEREHFLHGLLKVSLSFPIVMSGRLAEAIALLEEAVSAGIRSESIVVALLAMRILGEVYIMAGRLSQAEHTFQRAADYIESQVGKKSPLLGIAELGLGEVCRQRNDLARAEMLLTRGLEQTLRWMPAMGADGFMWLSKARQSQGKFAEAQNLLQQAHQVNATNSFPLLDDWFIGVSIVKLDILQGHLEAGLRWAQTTGLNLDTLDNLDQTLPGAPEHLREAAFYTLARLFLILGRRENIPDALEKAIALLDYTQPRSEKTGAYADLLEGLLLSTQVEQARGRGEAAQAYLHRAIDLAMPEKALSVFFDEGEPIQLLLAERQAMPLPAEERAFLDLICLPSKKEKGLPPPEPGQPGWVEPLSFRELEVLRWMAQGKSNQEIAAALTLSLNTVKKHVSAVIEKLQAKNRVEAVLIARQRELIDSERPR